MRRAVWPIALLPALLLPSPGISQAPAAQTPSILTPAIPTPAKSSPLPAFDVVSIKPNKSGSDNSGWSTGIDNFTATNVSIKALLTNAYGIREGLIFGLPGWTDSAHFDVNAKIVDPDIAAMKKLTREQQQAMIVPILVERFHARVHIETKILPVYELVLAKNGPMFKASAAAVAKPDSAQPDAAKSPSGHEPGSMYINDGDLTGTGVPLSMLTNMLAQDLNRTILDKTGLAGVYDLHLKWSPEQDQSGPDNGQHADNPAPPLFTALQEQLGLKLQPAKGPVETLVVDHIEMPSEN